MQVLSNTLIVAYEGYGTVRLDNGSLAHGRLGSTKFAGKHWVAVQTNGNPANPADTLSLFSPDKVLEFDITSKEEAEARAQAADISQMAEYAAQAERAKMATLDNGGRA